MKRRFGRRRKKPPILLLAVLLLLLCYSYYVTEKNIKPTLLAMSEIKARLIATEAIAEAVNKKMESNSFNNLVEVKTDNNGKITMVQANTIQMNKLATETSLAIQDGIKDIATKGIKIPISNILGSQIFANMGPKINISIQPAGSVSVDFSTEFEEAGINQTRLKIYLIAKTNVQIVIPLASDQVDVVSHIPVSETIIVGDVPESYVNVPKDGIGDYVPIGDPINK